MSSVPCLETIPDVITGNLQKNPGDPFWIYADTRFDKLVTITQLEFGRATHRAAHLLRPSREGPDGQVVALLSESDTMLYNAVLVGLMTANYVAFPISPRNSAPAIYQLLRGSSCHDIVATCVTLAPLLDRLRTHIADVDPAYGLNIQEMPAFQKIYPHLGIETSAHAFKPYPQPQNPPDVDDICMYIHSSGSTGFPKAIPQRFCILPHWFTGIKELRENVQSPISNLSLPSFHLYGLRSQVFQPLFGIPVAIYPPRALSPELLPMAPTPDSILEHTRKTGCRSLSTVPTLLVTWYNSPESLEYLTSLHTIIWGGGPLPQRVGDGLVDAGIHLISGYGTTETGSITDSRPYPGDDKDWSWFRVSDRVKVRWVPQGDGTFECQLLRTGNHFPMVENLPDVRGYATSDLCINHPTKKHLWRVVGRLDDTIIHSSGEKTVPAPMENIIGANPLVKGALIFGRERPQTGVLIETPPDVPLDVNDPIQVAEMRNKVWPVIQEANSIAPGFSRVFKEMILFASPDRPLPRAGKGTILRKAALDLYAAEIDLIYKAVDDQLSVVDSIEPPASWDAGSLEPWLMDLAANVCSFTDISPTVDLRQQGFDSLTSTVFRLHIIKVLRTGDRATAAAAIPQNLVYARPTIAELATFLEALVAGILTDADIQTADTEYSQPSLTETVVELRSSGGIPLIMFPGIRGTIDAGMALRANFSGTLWGIQIVDSTPVSPFSSQAAYITEKIREKRPKGPYRLTSYSGTSVVAVAVTKLLEESGEHVVQLSFIDHFPLLWTIGVTQAAVRNPEIRKTMSESTFKGTIQLLRHDPLYGPESDRLKKFEAAESGSPDAQQEDLDSLAVGKRTIAPLVNFLSEFAPAEASESEYADAVNRWVSSVKAPLSALTAEFGVLAAMTEEVRREYGDLGVGKSFKPVKHLLIPGVGHYGILGDKRTVAFLGDQC